MAVTVKPVVGLGVRIMKIREWTAIDMCGPAGDSAAQQDTAKFKEVTFCNILKTGPVTIHVAVFNRSAFQGAALTTELNAANVALMLQYETEIPVGATFSIKDFYMDKFWSNCEDMGDEPVVAVWVAADGETETGFLDVIQRR